MLTYCATRELNVKDELDRATASENIISALIGDDDVDGNGWQRKRLRTLRLYGLNMSGVAIQLHETVDLQRLSSLTLQRCENEVSLLRTLAVGEDGQCERLRHLTIIQSPDTPKKLNRDTAISAFLESFQGLESLVVSAPKSYALTPVMETVAHHESILRTLYLDCMWNPDAGPTSGACNYLDLKDDLAKCSKLEQLACDIPDHLLQTGYFDDDDELAVFVGSIALRKRKLP